MITDYAQYFADDADLTRYLEEEVGTCFCPECKDGAVVHRITDTHTNKEQFLSNCCYASVDISFCCMDV